MMPTMLGSPSATQSAYTSAATRTAITNADHFDSLRFATVFLPLAGRHPCRPARTIPRARRVYTSRDCCSRRIFDAVAVAHDRERGQLMRLRARRASRCAGRSSRARAAHPRPGGGGSCVHCASAHMTAVRLASAERLDAHDARAEVVRLHVVGVAAERLDLPAGVGRVGPRPAEAAQALLVHVLDARRRVGTTPVTPPRTTASGASAAPSARRPGRRSPLRLEQLDEPLDRVRRMPDRQDLIDGPQARGVQAQARLRRDARAGRQASTTRT